MLIDEYKGEGGGPKSRPNINGVEFINCVVGNSEGHIKDESFDIVFSVSVVEHVPSDQLEKFFRDCRRILKPGGLLVHLIDVYAEDGEDGNSQLWERAKYYLAPFHAGVFAPTGELEFQSAADLKFRTSFATNPDNIMRDWNVASPTLVEKRKLAQSCSFEMVGTKK